MNVLTNGYDSDQVSEKINCAGSLQVIVWSTTPSQQHEAHPGHQESRDRGHRGWRSRLSLHCRYGWSDNVMSRVELRRKGKSVPIGPNPADKATHELTKTISETASATACERELLTTHITDNHTNVRVVQKQFV